MEVDHGNRGGLFQEGGPGGPGRPSRRSEERILTRLWELTTDEDLDAGLRKIIEGFTKGHKFATKLFMEYMVGLPKQRVEIKDARWLAVAERMRAAMALQAQALQGQAGVEDAADSSEADPVP